MSAVGIRRLGDEVHWSDLWFYGLIPSALYALLGLVALGVGAGLAGAEYGVALIITALLLIAIRNEWDLITWIAPRHDGDDAPDLS
jgi:hypothetical protein